MNDSSAMSSSQCIGDLQRDQKCGLQLQRPPVDELTHVAAFDILHGYEMDAFYFVEIEDSTDVWMIERGSKASFTFETPEVCLFGSQLLRQDFDYNRATKFGVSRFIDCSLPTCAKLFRNPIVA